ncbi:hypothetical protein MKEN_00735000 [Mycena kentingensis (nom. inval.)]|nr:hypothetical protein MKEN_00735000 [Mycena kentingensis (nom. inval.)]
MSQTPRRAESSPQNVSVPPGVTLVFNLEGPGTFTLNLNISSAQRHFHAEAASPSPLRHPRQQRRVDRRVLPYLTPRRARIGPASQPGFEFPHHLTLSPAAPSERSTGFSVTEDSFITDTPPQLNLYQDDSLRERGATAVYLNGLHLGSVTLDGEVEEVKAEVQAGDN